MMMTLTEETNAFDWSIFK